MKILIAIPCADLIDVGFVDSLIHLQTPPGSEIDIQFAAGSLVYDARNKLARMAVDESADFILWLDSDMTFDSDLLTRLIDDISDKEMVCGMFFGRRAPFKAAIYSKCRRTPKEDGSVDIEFEAYKPIPNGIVEVEACGMAAVLMRTSLMEEIFEKGGLPFSPMLGFGEDLSCCIRLTGLGHKLHCDTDLYVGHTARVVVGGQDLKQSWNEQ